MTRSEGYASLTTPDAASSSEAQVMMMWLSVSTSNNGMIQTLLEDVVATIILSEQF